jgi:hypothetical protein
VFRANKISATFATIILSVMVVVQINGILSSQGNISPIPSNRYDKVVLVAPSERDVFFFALPARLIITAEVSSPVTVSFFHQQKHLDGIIPAAESKLSKSFSAYVFKWISFPIGLPKAFIIFPFHYFW